MSGIFKCDSIYKNGSGGGGYKNGGELADGDFIKVENNTNSSYNNETRNPINFYFEVKENEILNSVIEITTTINAIVNVYTVKNHIYYLIGNIGGNTVNAGTDYKVNITGDSYSIEAVSNKPTIEYIEIGQKLYGTVKIGNRHWTIKNLIANAADLGITGYFFVAKPDQDVYSGYYYGDSFNTQNYKQANEFLYPFRLPTDDDWVDLKNSVNNQTNAINALGWPNWPNANNSSGFSAVPCGGYNMNSGRSLEGYVARFLSFNPNSDGTLGSYSLGLISTENNTTISSTYPVQLGSSMGLLRLCTDA